MKIILTKRNRNNDLIKNILYIVCLAIIVIIFIFMNKSQHHDIETKVSELGGTLVSAESSSMFDSDPFPWYEHGKNVYVYKFTFTKGGAEHNGWVLFPSVGNPNWIVDGKVLNQ